MFKSQEQFTNSMFGAYSYHPIIERNQNHLLVKMAKLIDWSFIEEEVMGCYSEQGQRAIHPARIFKMLIVQALYDLSEREVCEQTDCNIIFRYFINLGLNDDIPHWTDLGKFKERLGHKKFEHLFYRVLDEAERLGLEISQQRIVDTMDIKSRVDLKRCALDKKGPDDHGWVDRNTTDPDADFGRKSKDKSWHGFKGGINQDAKTNLVTAVSTTKASVPDGAHLIPLIDRERQARGQHAITQQGGDKGFIGQTDAITQRSIKDFIIPRDNMTKEREKKQRNNHYLHLKKQRYKIEQKISEAKNQHGLGQTRYRGIWRVHLGCLIIYMAINLKRIVNFHRLQTA